MSTIYADLYAVTGTQNKNKTANSSITEQPSVISATTQQTSGSSPEITAGGFCRKVPVLSPDASCREVLGRMRDQPEIPCMIICDGENKPQGLVMRDAFYRRLTGRFAADLYFSRPVCVFGDPEALVMDIDVEPRILIQHALNRPESQFYDCVILTERGALAGILTVMDLMMMSGALQTESEKRRAFTVAENFRHVNGMEHSLRQVAEAASMTLEECHQMKAWSVSGRAKLDEVRFSYAKVTEHMNSNRQQVSKLMQDVDMISSLTQSITEMADKSGLLAINASIEAAHAGEHGRGFQVVARRLDRWLHRHVSLRQIYQGFLAGSADWLKKRES